MNLTSIYRGSRRTLLSLVLAGLLGVAHAQSPVPLHFAEYLSAVEQSSIDYAAQRQNVVAARAGIDLAGVRPDPQLSLGTSRELARESKSTATRPNTLGLSQTIETAGKRARRIDAAKADLRLAETVAQMAHNFGFSTVAEGIERNEHAELLREIGCNIGQGFLYSPPLKAAAFVEFCRRHAAAPRPQPQPA